uniref:F-box domain-containing protein n=1 Tax=Fagus sylvatica TaxID=28930 RepID=A0A2N9GGV9_FAGSY
MSDNLAELSKSLAEDLHTESMWDWELLPPEILIQSLSLLPIKTLITCTSVSKTWKSIIQNPTFISNHLHLSNNNNNNNLFLFRLYSKELLKATRNFEIDEDGTELYKLYWDNNNKEDFNEHTSFDFPFHGESFSGVFDVVGTYNGLFCLTDDVFGTYNGLFCLTDDVFSHSYSFILWNPCVRKFVKLPPPNVSRKTHGLCIESTGFGFDAKTNDYKVVRFVTLENAGRIGEFPPEVEVYSLAIGEWRMVTALAPIGDVCGPARQAFINGALHSIALKKVANNKLIHFVMVFDLGDEVFCEMELPKFLEEDVYWAPPAISAYGNSLALFRETVRALNIWVMKEYADASSWTKIYTFAVPRFGYHAPRPIAFRRSGEVILENLREQLVSCDLESQKIKDLGIAGYGFTFSGSYVESLVLLDKPNRAVTY